MATNEKDKVLEIFHEILNEGKGMISEFLAQQITMVVIERIMIEYGREFEADEKYWNKVKAEAKKLFHHKT